MTGSFRSVRSAIDRLDFVQFTIRGRLLASKVRTLRNPIDFGQLGKREPIVLSVVRNGMPWLKSFLAHHRQIGIRAFVILDNGSQDASVEHLMAQPDVILLQSEAPYNSYENTFKRYLCDRFGMGRWCLFVDVDELFYYPGISTKSVQELTGFLDGEGFDAALTQMLDMFANMPMGEIPDTTDLDPVEVFPFYETASINRTPFLKRFGNIVPDYLEKFSGGVRFRVFGSENSLTKVSLFANSGRLRPFHLWHNVRNAKLADCSFALLHFPFNRTFRDKVIEAVSTGRYGWVTDDEYDAYAKVMEVNPSLNLMSEHSCGLTGPMQLVDEGFLTISSEFGDWLAAK
ncbi:MAG: glycosyltransferase family 2 protein [Novosphingobium sp.]|nr:glycosyltransferase family 2 protein [Novosphingobium sp.]